MQPSLLNTQTHTHSYIVSMFLSVQLHFAHCSMPQTLSVCVFERMCNKIYLIPFHFWDEMASARTVNIFSEHADAVLCAVSCTINGDRGMHILDLCADL